MKTKITLAVLFFGLLLTSCVQIEGVKGSGDVTTETLEIKENFEGIKASNAISVILTQAKETSIKVETDDNLHEILKVYVEDEILHIYFDRNIRSAVSRKVYVGMPIINSLQASSASSITGENTIETEDLDLNASSAASINVEVKAFSISSNSSSAASIKLKGTCTELDADASSASNIKAKGLETKIVRANASSAASIKVFASKTLYAEASSGASVNCYGDPEDKSVSESSGGSINMK